MLHNSGVQHHINYFWHHHAAKIDLSLIWSFFCTFHHSRYVICLISKRGDESTNSRITQCDYLALSLSPQPIANINRNSNLLSPAFLVRAFSTWFKLKSVVEEERMERSIEHNTTYREMKRKPMSGFFAALFALQVKLLNEHRPAQLVPMTQTLRSWQFLVNALRPPLCTLLCTPH